AWLLSEDMLGGFHFNDRRYADDDLTMGSIDPYQVFRIFHEIHFFEWETGQRSDIAYMWDQSHNIKGKMEAMIQTGTMAQQLCSKAALVDKEKLVTAQKNCDLVRAESLLRTLSRRMSAPPSKTGEIGRAYREIRCKRSGRVAIWSASQKNGQRRTPTAFLLM